MTNADDNACFGTVAQRNTTRVYGLVSDGTRIQMSVERSKFVREVGRYGS